MKSIYQNVVLEARKRIALSQSDFGRLLGSQISSVSRYERGLFTPPDEYIKACKSLLQSPISEIAALRKAFLNQPTANVNNQNEIEIK
jgi:transcriptional regulator with XRE-family HTH domain